MNGGKLQSYVSHIHKLRRPTYGFFVKFLRCSAPLALGLPSRLSYKGRERKPVIVLVLLEISEGDEQKAGELCGRLVLEDALPDLVCDGGEERGLVRVLEVLDGVEVLEQSVRCHGVLRQTGSGGQMNGREWKGEEKRTGGSW